MFLNTVLVLLFCCFGVTTSTTYTCDPTAACGCTSASAVVSRIYGGQTALNNTFGWAVSILFNNTFYCTGTLISSSWIVTAAGCAYSMLPGEILVSAATNQYLGLKQGRIASALIIHPNFDQTTYLNNIALIQVSPPFNMSDPGIAQICLPAATTDDVPPVNASLVAAGWGYTTNNGGAPEYLQQATLQCLPSNTGSCFQVIVNQSLQFCAGLSNNTKGVCPGDSGGPMMMFTTSQQWVLVGLISYGFGCSNTGYPSLNMRITPYLNFFSMAGVTGTVTVGSMTISTTSVTSVTTSASGSTISSSGSTAAQSSSSTRSSATTSPTTMSNNGTTTSAATINACYQIGLLVSMIVMGWIVAYH